MGLMTVRSETKLNRWGWIGSAIFVIGPMITTISYPIYYKATVQNMTATSLEKTDTTLLGYLTYSGGAFLFLGLLMFIMGRSTMYCVDTDPKLAL